MNCAICEALICCHGTHTVSSQIWKCAGCGSIGINGPASIYCLPIHEGKVMALTDVFSSVCKECHDREIENL